MRPLAHASRALRRLRVLAACALVIAACDGTQIRVVTDRRLDATAWWRVELRAGTDPNGDVLMLTNPVWVGSRPGQ